MHHSHSRPTRAALYVRIPTEQAEALDRLAFECRRTKQDVVAAMLARSMHDTRKVTVELGEDPSPVVGRHSFRPHDAEVLSLEEAAELLQVEVETVEQLAEKGEIPGRRLGEQWRFSRRALIDWLGGEPGTDAS